MNGDVAESRELISVLLATFNESTYIERCVNSLLNQQISDFDLEVLAIDGKSVDGTREILEKIAARDSRVRLLVNEERKIPFAFNLGLQEAKGKYVCIFGAHTLYRKDYIAVCLKELIAHHAVGCGGRVVTLPSDETTQALLVAWAMGHPFGSSRKSFRTQAEGYVDTVNYPIMRREALLEVGGYDVQLARNEDNDISQRLRARGYRLFCTWKTQSLYHPKGKVKDLLWYASRNGFWNVVSLERNFESMGARHFVPFLFLVGMIISFLLATLGAVLPTQYRLAFGLPLVALLGVYMCLGLIAALQVAIREKSLSAMCLPLVFLGFHVAYGVGTLAAFVGHLKLLLVLPECLMTRNARIRMAMSLSRSNRLTRNGQSSDARRP